MRARVPVACDPCRIGRDPSAEIVVDDARVAPVHARVRFVRGEYVLGGDGGANVHVNGRRAPMLPLRNGDLVTLTPPDDMRPLCMRFLWPMEGSFVPPDASAAACWMAHPAYADPANGPARFGPPEPMAGRDPARLFRGTDPEGAGDVVVKILGATRAPEDGDRWIRLLAAVAGAPHPDLAFVLDGGLSPGAEGALRWLSYRHEAGTPLSARLVRGPLAPREALRMLRSLARAVEHLHRRGVVHRDVAPSNVLLREERGALLLDYGAAFRTAEGAPAGRGVVGTPGFVAPEEVLGAPPGPAVDVYGLAAVGYAAFTGEPPAAGRDLLETLARSGTPPLRPSALGVRLPESLEGILLDALSADPAARPDASAFERALAFAEAALSVGRGA